MTISALTVKELREATGAGMMDCKKALSETNGDFEEAKLWLAKKGIADTRKRSGRTASEGIVVTAANVDGHRAAILEVNCETDFVARNENFVQTANDLVQRAVAGNAPTANALLELDWDGAPVGQRFAEFSSKTGERMVIRRLAWVEVPSGKAGAVGSYIHPGAKVAVALAVTTANDGDAKNAALTTLVRDLCLHIAASDPLVVSADQVDAALVARQKEIFSAQAAESGKPPEIVEKMVVGKLAKWKKEVALLDQPFVKDPELTVDKQLAKVAKETLSGPVSVVGFVRYKVGEGLEKSAEA